MVILSHGWTDSLVALVGYYGKSSNWLAEEKHSHSRSFDSGSEACDWLEERFLAWDWIESWLEACPIRGRMGVS